MTRQDDHTDRDRMLVQRALHGDHSAFRQIVESTEALVAQIIFKMIGNYEDKKDIAQEVYLKVYKHLPGFKFQCKLSTWIGQIAFNASVNHLQQQKIWLPVHPDDFGPPEPYDSDAGIGIEKREFSDILAREIDQLPPLYKTVITLYHNEDQSYAEIAAIMGLPEGTVKSYLFRARKTLKDRLLFIYKKEQQ